jgi:hypothetical protein
VLLKDKEALADAVAVASNVGLPEGTKGKLVTLDMELLLCLSNAIKILHIV